MTDSAIAPPSNPLDRYRVIADGFSARVVAVPAGDARWSSPSPCAGWTARDVVRHLVEAHDIFYGLIEHDPRGRAGIRGRRPSRGVGRSAGRDGSCPRRP